MRLCKRRFRKHTHAEDDGLGGFTVQFRLKYASVAMPDLTRLPERRDDQGRIPTDPGC